MGDTADGRGGNGDAGNGGAGNGGASPPPEPKERCPSCAKPLRNVGPSGYCLTCEYKLRTATGALRRPEMGRPEVVRSDAAPSSFATGLVSSGDLGADVGERPPSPAALGATIDVASGQVGGSPPPLDDGSGALPLPWAPIRATPLPEADATLDRPAPLVTAPMPALTAASGAGRTQPTSLPAAPYSPADVLTTIDDYDLVGELGRGGMGVVYRAWAKRLGRYVALKLIRSGEQASELEVARFLNEAMLAGRLSHPNIVRVYDARQTQDGASYFVMELIEGATLGGLLEGGLAPDAAPAKGPRATRAAATRATATRATATRAAATRAAATHSPAPNTPAKVTTPASAPSGSVPAGGPGREDAVDLEPLGEDDARPPARLTLRQAIEIIEKTARAVEYAHGQAVVHRDIKPDNILVDPAFEPHVTDFGIAKAIREETVGAALTMAGHVMGSPHYMSPEQANGEVAAIGPRSDVYSLGATLYQVLTGRTMFSGPTPMSIVLQVLIAEAPRPSLAAKQMGRPSVPLDLETLCVRATEKEATRRFASAGELADELRRWLDGEPILSRPVSAVERLRKKLRKNRRALIGSFVAATLLLTLGAAFTLSLFDNVDRSSQSLKELDRAQALSQAATLERAIRVNMLQGRADLARELVTRLQADPTQGYGSVAAGSIQVARIDKTPAYTDRKTRRQVEQRLAKPEVMAEIQRDHPELIDEIAELRRRAFPSIDKAIAKVAPKRAKSVRVHEPHWRKAIQTGEPVTYVEELPSNRRRMVVLKPIENSRACQACHGGASDYLDNKVRAVLVVRRPLDRLEQMIDSNRESTLIIGSSTVAVLLILAALYARIFGIGLRRRRFGGEE